MRDERTEGRKQKAVGSRRKAVSGQGRARQALRWLGFALTLVLCSCEERQKPQAMEVVKIQIGQKTIEAEVADTYQTRAKGLKHRDSLPKDHGMIFVYPDEDYLEFWMKETKLPLSIAYIKADGWIAQISDMQPFSLETCRSQMRVKYALEMEQGWFAANEVKVGDRAVIPPAVMAKE